MTIRLLDDAATYPAPSFVERQFDSAPTPEQIIFDMLLGIILPVLCFYFDPGIIHGNVEGVSVAALLPHNQVAIYSLSGLAIVTLAVWLGLGSRLKHANGAVGVALLTGALFSFTIGIVIFPLTIMGLVIGVGVLGFVPFITALVYLRNGIRAIKQAKARMPRFSLVASLLLGAGLITGIPLAAQWKTSQMVSESMAVILQGDNQAATDRAINRLQSVKWLVDKNQVFQTYQQATDIDYKKRLARLYAAITGETVEQRLMRMQMMQD